MPIDIANVFHLLLNLIIILVIIATFILVIVTCFKVIKYIDFKMKDKD